MRGDQRFSGDEFGQASESMRRSSRHLAASLAQCTSPYARLVSTSGRCLSPVREALPGARQIERARISAGYYPALLGKSCPGRLPTPLSRRSYLPLACARGLLAPHSEPHWEGEPAAVVQERRLLGRSR